MVLLTRSLQMLSHYLPCVICTTCSSASTAAESSSITLQMSLGWYRCCPGTAIALPLILLLHVNLVIHQAACLRRATINCFTFNVLLCQTGPILPSPVKSKIPFVLGGSSIKMCPKPSWQEVWSQIKYGELPLQIWLSLGNMCFLR